MPSINIDVDYFEHFKTKRLASKLGENSEIMPIKLWVLAARFYPENGLFKSLKPQELLDLAGIKCNKDACGILQGLVDVGFLIKTRQGYKIHEWEEYQGHIIAYKIRGKHANQVRWSKLKPKVNVKDIQVEPIKNEEVVWEE